MAVNPDTCKQPRQEERFKIDAIGRKQFMMQCLDCGTKVGNYLRRIDHLVQHFDECLFEAGQEARRRTWDERRETIQQEFDQKREQEYAEFTARRIAHMQTPYWRSIRALVLQRDNRLCQGCLKRPATEVHHHGLASGRPYDHLGQEFAFELVSLCSTCHQRWHGRL